MISLAIGGLGC